MANLLIHSEYFDKNFVQLLDKATQFQKPLLQFSADFSKDTKSSTQPEFLKRSLQGSRVVVLKLQPVWPAERFQLACEHVTRKKKEMKKSKVQE